jgi:hypothetical protein
MSKEEDDVERRKIISRSGAARRISDYSKVSPNAPKPSPPKVYCTCKSPVPIKHESNYWELYFCGRCKLLIEVNDNADK